MTNELNLPQPFVDAATDHHKFTPRRYSVTTILGGTCEAVLKRRHAHETVEDVSDRVWAILGTAVHKVLESAQSGPEQHQEQWLCVPVDVDGRRYELSGIFDLYDEATGTVTDWKVTSVWKGQVGDYEDWRTQTLLYCWMLRQKGHDARRGQIVAIMRDHSKRKAMAERDYPKHPVIVIDWDFTESDLADAGEMVKSWFALVSKQENRPDSELLPCDPTRRWHKPDRWAVVKEGRKRATRVFESEDEAKELVEHQEQFGVKNRIEHRPGEDTRCQSYCPVAQFCPYGKKFFQEI